MIHTIIYTGLAPDLEDVKINVWDNYGSQVVVDGVLTYIDNNVYYFNFDIQDLYKNYIYVIDSDSNPSQDSGVLNLIIDAYILSIYEKIK